ncbi:hypothetical protein [Dishui Lake virophage 5]|nr:hypothetical protein [Dishui Lake virophage 5]
MDRLQALLNGRKPHVRDPVSKEKVNHATERARLNNADRYFNQKVYDNELKQANLYNQSAMPNTAKDVGVGFKINVYVIRLTQLLGQKGELEKMLTNFFAAGVNIQRLRGTTREAQTATDFFKKGEILATYNELMTYIKTYGQEIINDQSFQSQIYNSSFNPLTQLLTDTAALYPAFFDRLPPPERERPAQGQAQGAERTDQRRIYETAREQSIGCYSLFNTMSDFINNMIFRPIVKEDIETYIKDNSVKQIFQANSLAPPAEIPIPLPLQPQPAPLNPQQGQPQPAPVQPQDPQQGQAPAPVYFDPTPQNLKAAVEAYSASLNPPRYLFSGNSASSPNTDLDGVYQSIQNKNPATPAEFFKNKIGLEIQKIRQDVKARHPAENFGKVAVQNPSNIAQSVRLYADDQQAQQPQQPQPQPPAPQQGQQGQQGGPAPAPQPQPLGQSLRDVALQQTLQTGDPITTLGDVWIAMNGDQIAIDLGLNQMEIGDLRAVVRDTLILIRQIEDQRGSILRSKTPADVDAVLAATPQATMTNLDRLLPDAQDKRRLIQEIINGMRDVRIDYRNIKAQDDNRPDYQQNRDERTLYGLGQHAERNNNLAMNAVFDFENMARRKAQHTDIPTITEITPQMAGYEEQLAHLITKLNLDRRLEPSTWGKGKTEYKQGVVQRAIGMPNIMEYDPKVEALKRGKIMSGGCDTTGSMRGGMDNVEWNFAGYGEVENEEDTPFKRMIIGMPNPFAPSVPESGGNFMPYDSRFSDEEDGDYYNEVITGEGSHYADLEKPVDLDEQADQIRKNNENYKVMTGKMKSVKYKN